MDNIDLMNFWIESSNEDYNVMNVLYNSKKNSYSLFFGQMVIEKLLKALYAKNNKEAPHAPKTHDLLYLTGKLNLEIIEEKVDRNPLDLKDVEKIMKNEHTKKLELTEEQEVTLSEITKFNLSTRYGDYKREFYNKCTDEYTKEQIAKIQEVKIWIEKMLDKEEE